MSRIIAFSRWAIVIGLVMLGALYAVEGLRLQTETLTFYDSTRLKNGRDQVFYDQPQTEICVHTVFPHGGRRPCWYARRELVRRVS